MKPRSYVFIAAVITLIACGGGGGGSGAKFAGVWAGTISLVEDTCGIVGTDSQYIFFTHLINQDEEDIVLDNGAITFTGETDGDNSFTASVMRDHAPLSSGAECTEEITWRYEQVKRDNAPFVVRSSKITCASGQTTSECTFAFSGSAFRTDGNGGGPIILEGDADDTIDNSGAGDAASETTL